MFYSNHVVSTSLQALLDYVMAPEAKRRKKNSNIQQSFTHTHAWTKEEGALKMVDKTKGPQSFQHTTSGSDYSSTVSAAIYELMDLRAAGGH